MWKKFENGTIYLKKKLKAGQSMWKKFENGTIYLEKKLKAGQSMWKYPVYNYTIEDGLG